ncbi:MAG: hypothetical protein C0506_07055 [Anaerolinea sp.]|nr:hypothetical protein [Anaerolinea sp.]
MFRKLLPMVALLLVAAAGFRSAGLALFTDAATLDANSFVTATVDISTNPATALFNVTAMVPGDTVTQSLVVTNAGTAQLRYAVTASATNADGLALKDQLALVIKTLGTNCATFDGGELYTGDLDSGVGGVIFGDTAQGAQAGDRTLNAAASETLCFRVSLPIGTGNGSQGAATTATYTFTAEQTANN